LDVKLNVTKVGTDRPDRAAGRNLGDRIKQPNLIPCDVLASPAVPPRENQITLEVMSDLIIFLASP
jgi:hypothetical protein